MNKKQVAIISSMILILTLSLTVLAQQQFKLIVDGKEVKTDMIIKDGVTYLPLRTISNELDLGLEFANGSIILNSVTSPTTSPSLPQAVTTSTPTTVNPPVVVPNSKYKYSNSPLSMEEILKGGKKDMMQTVEMYRGIGFKVTVEEDVTYLDEGSYGFGCMYTLKLDDGVESEWKKTSIYIIDPVGWRYYLNDDPIPMEKTWGGNASHHTIKTEKNKK